MASLAASTPATRNVCSPCPGGTRLHSSFLARRATLSVTHPLSRKSRRLTAVRAEAVEFATEAPEIADVISTPAPEVADVIIPDTPPPPSFLADFVDSTKAALSDAVESITDAADSALESVQDLADSAIESVQDFADSAIETVQEASDSVKETSQGLLEKAKNVIPAAPTTLAPAADVSSDVAPEPVLQAAEDLTVDTLPAVTGADVSIPAEIPDFGGVEIPEVPAVPSAPAESFSLPEGGLSDFKAPEFRAPDFKVPEFNAPDFKVPEFKTPDLKVPDFNIPEFKAPELNFNLPKFEKPGFSLPNFENPDFSLPKFERPEFKLPDFSSPDFNLQETLKSKLSEFTPPEIELPESIKSKLPMLPTLPALPSLPNPPTLPGLERVPLSKLKLSLPPAVTEPVKSAAADVAAAAEERAALASSFLLQQAALIYSQVKDQVPAEYQPYVSRVESNLLDFSTALASFSKVASAKFAEVSGDVVKATFEAVGYEVDESVISVTLITLGTGLFIVAYYRAVYGGYSGDVEPQESLKMLKESRSVLLDLRPQSVRDQEGIPDLRRGARFKDRNLQFDRYTGGLRGQLRNADSVDLQLFAATVKGLKGVSTGTSVIVMDESGSGQAKEIARGLAKYGFQRSYILAGGFKAWVDEGLRVKPNEPEALADLLQNEFEAFVEEVKPTPEGVLTVLAGTGVVIYALWEWERSLQILALALAAQIIYSRAKTYETSADLQKDIRIITAPFWLVATVLAWVGKILSPPSEAPKLATAGATADVEGAEEASPGKPEVQNGSASSRVLPAVAEAIPVASPSTEGKTEEKEEGGGSPTAPAVAELELPEAPVELELPAAPREPELPPAPVEPQPSSASSSEAPKVEAKAPEDTQKLESAEKAAESRSL